jgi:pyruvate,water dikinase
VVGRADVSAHGLADAGGGTDPDRVRSLPLPEALRQELRRTLENAGLTGARVAVRSSAVEEDGAERSYAGQFDSVLGVRADAGRDELRAAITQVWASALHAHAVAYRDRGGASPSANASNPPQMAVVIQRMVDPHASGVAFSADPVTGDPDVAVVSAVYGLGEGLVSGALDADTYRVRFGGNERPEVRVEVARKDRAVRMSERGATAMAPVPEPLWNARALDDDEARRVAAATRLLATRLGAPQDVEWALVDDAPSGPRRLVILQTRPITALGGAAHDRATPALPLDATGPRPDGERRIWDNSNIAESYSGVTTPLTFSFARSVYEDVYRQFCAMMGVSRDDLDASQPVFANMLGLMRGRVYYNLLNWYRTLALLPGFTFNRAFMERMMGVRERLEDEIAPARGGRARDLWRLIRMVVRMLRASSRLDREVPAFHARVERALAPLRDQDLGAWPPERVIALYRRLERELLHHWRPPLVNDFFAMIHFGVLGRLIERWLPGSPPTLANDLLCGEGQIISTEPARRVMELARRASASPELSDLLAREPDDRAVLERIATEPSLAGFHASLREYLGRFGDRCMEELKLETVTLSEDPTFLIQTIRAYAAQGAMDPEAAHARELRIRQEAEAAVRARLGGPKGLLFAWVLGQARRRVRDRENLRFERTRVFGVVRRIVLSLGGHLAATGRIAAPRDVFYLTREEIFAHFDGTGSSADLSALVRERRAEFDAYRAGPAPPDRFETYGPPAEWLAARLERSPSPPALGAATAAELRGMGCCPGVVRAAVRVVRDPREARDLNGRILVAERTDPGWTLLFPAAAGLLVQRGSLLSHSAIVAREMGLPCVVAIPGLLDTLVDGEMVEMDGTTGVVRRCART